MSERGRLDGRVLVALFAFLAVSAYVAYRTFEDVEEPRPDATPAADASDQPPTWVHHAWVTDAGAALPPEEDRRAIPAVPEGIPTAVHDRAYDPQRWAMLRELGVGAGDAGGALPFEPVERSAAIAELTGELPFERDASCTARILPARSGRYDCLVRVICDGHVVYPNPTQTAGYVECELDPEGRPVRAEDVGHTAVDGDPRLRVDLDAGVVTVSDAGNGVARFELRLRLQ